MTPARVAVIDIGKTNAKLALVGASDLAEIAVVTRPNAVLAGPPYPHFDVEAIWAFLLDGLAEFHRRHGVDAISVTTHGAAGALLAADGALAAPILDYEHPGPEAVAEAYEALRPGFAQTGSPRLPMGLNLGAQIHWQLLQDPGLRSRTAAIVTYPQYWGHRLTGALACDPSSLGCHTDLWDPHRRRFSSLVARLGIAEQMAPARASSDVLGAVRPAVADRTGLDPETPVACGIHDSNASLLPYVLRQEPPFSVVSTGTWVIAMTMGGAEVALDPARDTLVNVNALGAPVVSARFMGGREYELAQERPGADHSDAQHADVAQAGPMLLPALVPDSGPFQGRRARWVGQEPAPGTPERAVAVSFYLAMMTAECLALCGHRGPIFVEGPFAANRALCQMLCAATGCGVFAAGSTTGTSQGAALLALGPEAAAVGGPATEYLFENCQGLAPYATRWRSALRR